MQGRTERWIKLCQQAAVEEDPSKLLALVTEINNLLEAKQQRLKPSGASDLTPSRPTTHQSDG